MQLSIYQLRFVSSVFRTSRYEISLATTVDRNQRRSVDQHTLQLRVVERMNIEVVNAADSEPPLLSADAPPSPAREGHAGAVEKVVQK